MDGILTIKDLEMLDKHYISASRSGVHVSLNYMSTPFYKTKEDVEKQTSAHIKYDMGLHVVYFPCKENEVIELPYPIAASGIITNGTIKCPSIKAGIVYAGNIEVSDVLDAPCVVSKNGIKARKIIANEIACGKNGISSVYVTSGDTSMPTRIVSKGNIVCADISLPYKNSSVLCLGSVSAKTINVRKFEVKGDITAESFSSPNVVFGGTLQTDTTNISTIQAPEFPANATMLSMKGGQPGKLETISANIFKEDKFALEEKKIVTTLKDAIVEPEVVFERMERDNQTTDVYGRAK